MSKLDQKQKSTIRKTQTKWSQLVVWRKHAIKYLSYCYDIVIDCYTNLSRYFQATNKCVPLAIFLLQLLVTKDRRFFINLSIKIVFSQTRFLQSFLMHWNFALKEVMAMEPKIVHFAMLLPLHTVLKLHFFFCFAIQKSLENRQNRYSY